jgi:heme a synthase
MDNTARRQIGIWLMAGVVMIYFQVLLGGITRLTGSGLSITQWNVIMGSLPPLNHQQWQTAFDQYKQFPQYKLMNSDMDLGGFKSIFFWEYTHRLWGRLLGVVFILGFVYFLVKRKLYWHLIKNLLILFVLGALQGVMGWIMVQSGLQYMPWVAPIDLTAHLLLALLLYGYLLWMALLYIVPENTGSGNERAKGLSLTLIILLALQIGFGGLMAGTHAALFYPTWPKIGSHWIPQSITNGKPFLINLIQDTGTIQLVHRTLAYLICILVIYFFILYRKSKSTLLRTTIAFLPVIVLLQITLGVLTLLYTSGKIPVTFGVLHQATGWLAFTNVVIVYFLVVKKQTANQGL